MPPKARPPLPNGVPSLNPNETYRERTIRLAAEASARERQLNPNPVFQNSTPTPIDNQNDIARAQTAELYYTRWPDQWPEELKQAKKLQWLEQHKDMTYESMYNALMNDGDYWEAINTLVCVIPPNPATNDQTTLQNFYHKVVVWAGVQTDWARDNAVIQRGAIPWDQVARKFNRALECPGFQLRANFISVGDKIGDKLGKISDMHDKVMEGIGNAASGTGDIVKNVGDNPTFSFTAVMGIIVLAAGAIVLRGIVGA